MDIVLLIGGKPSIQEESPASHNEKAGLNSLIRFSAGVPKAAGALHAGILRPAQYGADKEKPGTDIIDTQLAYSIRFYCMGSVGMTQE